MKPKYKIGDLIITDNTGWDYDHGVRQFDQDIGIVLNVELRYILVYYFTNQIFHQFVIESARDIETTVVS
jgi:hypothetical protein